MKRARPLRRCIGCGAVKEKKELVRLVSNEEGEVIVDREGLMEGRGGYVCRDIECVRKACRGNRLSHAFRRPVKPCAPDLLWSMIEEGWD